MRARIQIQVAFFVLAALTLPRPALCQVVFNSAYDAATGTLPTAACPPWTVTDTASPEDPTVAGGVLTISTSSNTENISFQQSSPNFAVFDTLVIEFSVKLVSGSSSIPSRGPVSVAVTTAPSVGSLFLIASGEMFLTSAPSTKGPTAAVATEDDFHVYRIQIVGSSVRVFYDGVLKLTGSTYGSAGEHGDTPRVLFGEGSTAALGHSEWRYFRHNAGGVPCTNPTFTSAYDPSTGLFPNQTCPPWSLVNSEGSTGPSLSGGALIFSTGTDGSRQYYWQPDIAIPDTLVIEFRVKLDFGSSSQVARGPIGVAVTVDPNEGILFYIDGDEMFFAAGHGPLGQLLKGSSAFVATTDGFHTYRIELTHTSVSVYYDGQRKLFQHTYVDSADHGQVRRILFGEGSVAAQGQSEWQFIRHNAAPPQGPPITFDLQSPADGDTVSTWRVPLDWTNSIDPDCGAPVTYQIEVDAVSTFPNPSVYGPRTASRDTVVVPFVPGKSYYWRVRARDGSGAETWALPGFRRFVTYAGAYPTGVDAASPEARLALHRAQPNPFNPSTRIQFELPGATATSVLLAVYDVHGRRVRVLLNANLPPGLHGTTWDGTNDEGTRLASGVYYCMLSTGAGTRSIHLVVTR